MMGMRKIPPLLTLFFFKNRSFSKQTILFKKYSIIAMNKTFRVLIMDKSFLVFLAIGIGFLYFVTNFVGDIQKEDDKYSNDAYNQEHMYDKYQAEDGVGRSILNLLGEDPQTQIAVWNASRVKEDYIAQFPDFEEMKKIAKERINGEALSAKLISQVNTVEDRFFSGAITTEQARQELSTLK
jgi:hypothetical protein